MTANQIMIPIAGLILVAWIAYLALRTRRMNAERIIQREHSANTPDSNHDKGAIARSLAHGQGLGGNDL